MGVNTMYEDGKKARSDRLKKMAETFSPNRPLTDWHDNTLGSIVTRMEVAEECRLALYQYTNDYTESLFFPQIKAIEGEIRSLTPWRKAWEQINSSPAPVELSDTATDQDPDGSDAWGLYDPAPDNFLRRLAGSPGVSSDLYYDRDSDSFLQRDPHKETK